MATSFKRRGVARPSAAGAAARTSLYEEVTQRIIAELEAGRFPWVQPWSSARVLPGLPTNAVTGRRYSGINILLLWDAVATRGYPAQRWLTFRQAYLAGGGIRRGEHGVTIYYADRFVPFAPGTQAASGSVGGHDGRDGRDGAAGGDRAGAHARRAPTEGDRPDRRERDDEAPASIPFLKRFTVFNVAQCEGLPDRLAGAAEPAGALGPHAPVPAAERLITACRAEFRVGGDCAYYDPLGDYVRVPPQAAFHEPINYYRTVLHELGHWTGHESRLRRDQSGRFATASYAREELVAEMASAFLCAALGIVPTVRHADYLGAWLDVLRGDARAIFRAASAASKAADFLLAFVPEPSDPAGEAGG